MVLSDSPALELATPPVAGAPAHISASGISVDFYVGPVRHRVLDDITLSVPKGGFTSLIGPSGCGKSTLLKVLAGLLPLTEGHVRVAGLEPAQALLQRRIGIVFQDATLMPWKNAIDNVSLLMEIADKQSPRAAIRDRAREMLRLVGLEDAARKRPSQLSGGMRQRVAIARALALDPEVLLMDEPFGALDAITREEMSDFLLEIWERTRKTIVLVTHSIEEAVFLSREVHVMATDPGRISATVQIKLSYPRGEESYAAAEFGQSAARLRRMLKEGHAKVRAS
jgi:NitT/TauT family transport system ATP-binding protein